MPNKYLAKGWYINPASLEVSSVKKSDIDIYFGSSLELNMYQYLRSKVKPEFIALQYPLEIRSPSVLYDPLTWKVDFRVVHQKNNQVIYIETKGKALNEFKRNLVLLAKECITDYKYLHIVGSKIQLIDKNIQQISFMHFKRYFEYQFLYPDWKISENPCFTDKARKIFGW